MRALSNRTLRTSLVLAVLFGMLAMPSSSAVSKRPRTSLRPVKICIHRKTGRIRVIRTSRVCRKRERGAVLGLRGPRGKQGPRGQQGQQGTQGPQGPPGADARAVFSSQMTSFSGAASPAFGGVSGIDPVTLVERQVETLVPAGGLTATNLAVRTSSAPGSGNSVTVTLRDDEVDTALSCTVSGTATTCTNTTASATISGGSVISLQLSSTGGVPLMSVFVGLNTS